MWSAEVMGTLGPEGAMILSALCTHLSLESIAC